MILLSTITFLNEQIILAQQIKIRTYSDNIIYEVCHIDTDTYNKESDNVYDKLLQDMCNLVACLHENFSPINGQML